MAGYVPHTERDRIEMLDAVGANEIDELFSDIPADIRLKEPLNLPPPVSEMEIAKEMKKLAGENVSAEEFICFLGAGTYDHYVPSVVKHLVQRSEFYTAYTPYQPEISQGTLQSIFERPMPPCMTAPLQLPRAP